MSLRPWILIGCLIAALCGASAVQAVEPWADPQLPLRDGLELWLDAERIGAGQTPPAHGAELARWPDASGHRRDFTQPAAQHQPRWVVESGEVADSPGEKTTASAMVALDGADDWLGWSAAAAGLRLETLTVLAVAAPESNLGGFRALLSGAARGTNDYVTGLNIDLGHAGRSQFDWLNVEGAGFGGERDLLGRSLPLGRCQLLAIEIGPTSVRVRCDGQAALERPRQPGAVSLDDLRLGARWYDNRQPSPGPQVSGFWHGLVAELLVYGRALSDAEVAQVETYLLAKHRPLLARPAPPEPPPVRMLAPGFEVRELPLSLTNVNSVQYDDRGRLFALGYDGRVRVLTDTDGDGLEDAAAEFFDGPPVVQPLSLLVAPGGVYVAGGKAITRFVDADGDGRAERRETVLQDWTPSTNYSGGVDALGLAMDRDGALYFGLGCDDFTNAYRVVDGQALYRLDNPRGTIQKLLPGAASSTTVCTGVRFPVGLAFNAAGDLFCTDQEGETWLPGGNPLDEINHIVPGRHYGFPPRDDTHLPSVVDEPPVVGIGPQHQSTCGMKFNDQRFGQRPFGPRHWHGQALVAGYSRGKLWRTSLVATPAGYVGQETLIAAVRALLVDTAVSPTGELLLACHGGAPDWGSGPQGAGRLFKIRLRDAELPQPVVAWAASAVETRVAFDKPLSDAWLASMSAAEIEYGRFVRAADRDEALRPGYDSVRVQLEAPRRRLAVASAELSADRRELVLHTDPHPQAATYAVRLTLPAPRATDGDEAAPPDAANGALDVAYRLSGVLAQWTPQGAARAGWSGWVPHLDTAAVAGLTIGSASHERLYEAIQGAGTLLLETRLSLPRGEYELEFQAAGARGLTLRVDDGPEVSLAGLDDWTSRPVDSDGQPRPLTIRVEHAAADRPLSLAVRYRREGEPYFNPLPLDALTLPWCPPETESAPTQALPPPQLAGGDWEHGRALFFGDEAKCSACHTLRGQGTKIGPDLSNLVSRDPESVLRDIAQPSAAINPEFIPFTVHTTAGRALVGLVRAEPGRTLRITGGDAKHELIAADDVEQMTAGSVSIMPAGIAEKLGPDGQRDLLTFLLLPPAAASQPIGVAPPPQRTAAEIAAVRNAHGDVPNKAAEEPLRLLMVWGHKDHGPGEHDYPLWRAEWSERLAQLPKASVRTALDWPTPDQWASADLVLLYHFHQDYSPARLAELDAYLARGGGLVVLHSATVSGDPEALAQRIGLAAKVGPTKYRHGPLELVVTDRAHPITRGIERLALVDETYWPMFGDATQVQVLATAEEEGAARPMLWTYRPGRGRVFGCILGHYSWTLEDPVFRAVWLRGAAWAAGVDPSRFDAF